MNKKQQKIKQKQLNKKIKSNKDRIANELSYKEYFIANWIKIPRLVVLFLIFPVIAYFYLYFKPQELQIIEVIKFTFILYILIPITIMVDDASQYKNKRYYTVFFVISLVLITITAIINNEVKIILSSILIYLYILISIFLLKRLRFGSLFFFMILLLLFFPPILITILFDKLPTIKFY